MSAQSTISKDQRDIGFLFYLAYQNRLYSERAVTKSVPMLILGSDAAMRKQAFSMSAKSLQKFLEEEEEGSIF